MEKGQTRQENFERVPGTMEGIPSHRGLLDSSRAFLTSGPTEAVFGRPSTPLGTSVKRRDEDITYPRGEQL